MVFGLLVAGLTACSRNDEPTAPDGGVHRDASQLALDGGFVAVDAADVADAWALDAASDAGADAAAPDADVPDAGPAPKIVILMIGDGMGYPQLEVASRFRHGQAGGLFMESLPHEGALHSGGLSGITDSAAAATAMATGVRAYNSAIGIDRHGQPAQTLVELAKSLGLGTGIVTTTYLSHATPGAFTAHQPSRHLLIEIADDQARLVQPDVLLGGGSRYYFRAGADSDRTDDGLVDPMIAAGYQFVTDRTALATATPTTSAKLLGIFASSHLDYVADRTADTLQPTLTEMTLAALRFLETNEDGFFLMVEGGRIDHGGHENVIRDVVHETLAFDDAIRAVVDWAAGRAEVNVIVTADHECGGLEIEQTAGVGQLPQVTWRWGEHTNDDVAVFASGPANIALDGATVDHVQIHAVAKSILTGEVVTPPAVLVPNGHFGDLRHRVAMQRNASGFGVGFNQLDVMHLDADEHGLAIGLEGVFEWGSNALVLLIDHDFGDGTGYLDLGAALSDTDGTADAILSALTVSAPTVPGFGADFAAVSFGGADPRIEDMLPDAGLRGLRPPFGDPSDLAWLAAATNFAGGTRTSSVAATPVAGAGYEIFIQWSVLYPDRTSGVPPGATVAITAAIVNDDGGFTSNQLLPALPASSDNPGRGGATWPAVVRFVVDSDGDGQGDGDAAPTLASP